MTVTGDGSNIRIQDTDTRTPLMSRLAFLWIKFKGTATDRDLQGWLQMPPLFKKLIHSGASGHLRQPQA
jgi:hypothetical protein